MTLVNSNVILDVFTNDPKWEAWSSDQLDDALLNGPIVINDIVYAEVSVRFGSVGSLDRVIEEHNFVQMPMTRDALFAAGKAFGRYRQRGGVKTEVIADFFVGAHAHALRCPLLTRDVDRYRKYFPQLKLISPGSA